MFKTCGVLLHPAHIKNGTNNYNRTTARRHKQPISAATKRNIRHRTKNKHKRNTHRLLNVFNKLNINKMEWFMLYTGFLVGIVFTVFLWGMYIMVNDLLDNKIEEKVWEILKAKK